MPLKKEASRSAAQAPTGMERWSGGKVGMSETLNYRWRLVSVVLVGSVHLFVSAVANKAQATEVSLWRENTTV